MRAPDHRLPIPEFRSKSSLHRLEISQEDWEKVQAILHHYSEVNIHIWDFCFRNSKFRRKWYRTWSKSMQSVSIGEYEVSQLLPHWNHTLFLPPSTTRELVLNLFYYYISSWRISLLERLSDMPQASITESKSITRGHLAFAMHERHSEWAIRCLLSMCLIAPCPEQLLRILFGKLFAYADHRLLWKLSQNGQLRCRDRVSPLPLYQR